MLTLNSARAFRVIRPLAYRFQTAFSVREYISHIILLANFTSETGEKVTGMGEATTHSEPFYNGEFDQTELAFLNRVMPLLIRKQFESPGGLHELLDKIKFTKNHRFGIASLDIAFHDAFAQINRQPLAEYLINQYSYPTTEILPEIPAGVSIGMRDTPEILAETALRFWENGVRKIKLKIAPGKDIDFVKAVVNKLDKKDYWLITDANSSYDYRSDEDWEKIREICRLVYLLEQPFAFDDIWHHAQLIAWLVKEKIPVKIALDESLRNLPDLINLLDQVYNLTKLPVGEFARHLAVNIKISRIGGLYEAMQTALFCKKNRIRVMPGGMHEFDIGQAAIFAFSAIDEDFLDGDSEGAETYYPSGSLTRINGLPHHLLDTQTNGKLKVPQDPGLGIGILDFGSLEKIGVNTYLVKSDLAGNYWTPAWNRRLLDNIKADIDKQQKEMEFQ